ncbi:LysR family transcriptional regulator [Brevirhabdus pacifica]|uniref:LysR family transcriptional regulator n=1 Tax=Brevirhabdus pacifica TaxID=1267768 RepID=A0A1U7DJZ4_9RHOB|nr:LysR substrate-binding domain-containing protein [Brevirhabdus pacifica]APX90302.1 LysR family transcriptional regulator [Brevirhabdus pacifica]OWU78655.1 LysR family transcriptional regulator [Loktanella sp. 22II-4b]PJJ80752.1 DNA-binding transcriptional LysR family regulator [Brevirhabdus pacifica]
MLELRDMQLLLSLARHKHFARAAAVCGISQPAFSMRIRNLEDQLGLSIVKRGNRFQGFTEEGEIVLRWARRITDDARAMEQEILSAKGTITGTLTLGVVPTALAYASRLPAMVAKVHPGIMMRLRSASSLQIQQGIEDGSIDAGITYSDGVSADVLDLLPLYEETYVLVAPRSMAPRARGTATWAEAAALPLTLLVRDMQNRRILDRHFAEMNLHPQVLSENNAFTSSLVMVNEGFAATIVPQALIASLGEIQNAVALPLVEPELTKSICLVAAVRHQGLATVQALQRILGREA